MQLVRRAGGSVGRGCLPGGLSLLLVRAEVSAGAHGGGDGRGLAPPRPALHRTRREGGKAEGPRRSRRRRASEGHENADGLVSEELNYNGLIPHRFSTKLMISIFYFL